MKKNTHPKLNIINVVMTNGDEFQTKSTWGKTKEKLILNADFLTQQAWALDNKANLTSKGRVANFMNKFKNFQPKS